MQDPDTWSTHIYQKMKENINREICVFINSLYHSGLQLLGCKGFYTIKCEFDRLVFASLNTHTFRLNATWCVYLCVPLNVALGLIFLDRCLPWQLGEQLGSLSPFCAVFMSLSENRIDSDSWETASTPSSKSNPLFHSFLGADCGCTNIQISSDSETNKAQVTVNMHNQAPLQLLSLHHGVRLAVAFLTQ